MTFQQAQAPRGSATRKGAEPSLLGGLLRCAACSLAMRAFTVALPDGRRRRYYSCARRCAGGSCQAPASMAGSLLEPLVEQCFFEQLARPRPRADRPRSRWSSSASPRPRRRWSATATTTGSRRSSAPSAMPTGLAGARTHSRALLALGAARDRGDADPRGSAEALERRWPDMGVRERRLALGEIIECVFATRGRGQPAARIAICRRGEGPAGAADARLLGGSARPVRT